MIPINYHHLYYFWTAAKCGSIAAAKDRLYLSQPTLSSQLAELERACKAKLLDRSRKGVTLTREGRIVFDYCERIFTQGDELASVLESGFDGPSVLRVGIDATISRDAVVRILDFARRTDKTVRIAAFNGEIEVLGDRLRRHDLDMVVSNEDIAGRLGRGFKSRLVCSLPVYFVASPAVRRAITRFPQHLARVPMLMRPPGNPVREQVDEYLARHKVPAIVEADLEDVELIRRLAVGGRGVAAMNALAAGPDLRAGRLVRLHKAPTRIRELIWFTCSRNEKPNPALRGMTAALMSDFRVRD